MSPGAIQHGYPSPAAGRFVHRYIERKQVCSPGSVIATKPAVARSCPLLDFELGDPLHIQSCTTGLTQRAELVALVGLETHAKHHFLIAGHYHGFQIHFRSSMLERLFGQPALELTDRHYAAQQVLGAQTLELRQRLCEAASFEERIQLADAFVLKLSFAIPAHGPIERVAREMRRLQGTSNLDRIAREAGLSQRSFQRKFQEGIGVSPKLYARLIRFEAVLKTKAGAPLLSWMNAAHLAGYYDQMHMIRDFREFTGGSPTAMFGHSEELLAPHSDFNEKVSVR